jgi:hypothetical protein
MMEMFTLGIKPTGRAAAEQCGARDMANGGEI